MKWHGVERTKKSSTENLKPPKMKKNQNFYIHKSWKTFQLEDILYSKYLVNSIRIKNKEAK